jgi:RNA polymerase sigma-70 factor (ECF subfamily)
MTLLSASPELGTDADSSARAPGLVTLGRDIRRTAVASLDDLELLDHQMARLADGDRSVVEPLFRALWPAIHGYCERVLGQGADADDAAQQAMEKVFQEASQFDRTRHALPWALAITLWECRTVRRRNQRARAVGVESLPDVASGAMSPEDATIHAQLVAEARALLASLSPTDRQVLEETFAEEVEGRLSVPRPTLRKRRERALRRLREAWRLLYGR